MHPELLHQLNRCRAEELRRRASPRLEQVRQRTPRGRPLQGAAGWFLVEIGLRLAARDLVASGQATVGSAGR